MYCQFTSDPNTRAWPHCIASWCLSNHHFIPQQRDKRLYSQTYSSMVSLSFMVCSMTRDYTGTQVICHILQCVCVCVCVKERERERERERESTMCTHTHTHTHTHTAYLIQAGYIGIPVYVHVPKRNSIHCTLLGSPCIAIWDYTLTLMQNS